MVLTHPRLQTERLRLRPLFADDARALSELLGEREVADTAISVPHPFSLATARTMIAAHAIEYQTGRSVYFGIERKDPAGLVGCADLTQIDRDHRHAELNFSVGRTYQGQGYASEAALAVLRFGFSQLELNRIYARHMLRDPVSGAVLLRVGMKQEGVLRQGVQKWGVFEDLALYSVLRSDSVPV